MKRRYLLAPQAAQDLVDIWRYLKKESSEEIADRVAPVMSNGGMTSLPTCGFSRSI